MDLSNPMVRDGFSKIEAGTKTNVPWTEGEPFPQPYFSYSTTTKSWQAQDSVKDGTDVPARNLSTKISLYSWNIDFMLPFADERMTAALAHLETKLFPNATDIQNPPHHRSAIFFQELTATDLLVLQNTPWVQSHFHLTDITPEFWGNGHYGTTTLIDRRLHISSSPVRVHFTETKMDRDGLFVDVLLSNPSHTSSHDPSPPHILRLCNTHLESLISDPPLRPLQLATCASYMHNQSQSSTTTTTITKGTTTSTTPNPCSSSLLAGDLNAIQPFDSTLHLQPNIALRDAFLSSPTTPTHLRAPENAFARNPETDTWGFTAPTHLREMFGTTRMDKILFCSNGAEEGAGGGGSGGGRGGLRVVSFERFGWDVVIDSASASPDDGATVEVTLCPSTPHATAFRGRTKSELLCKIAGTERAWVTDHLGIVAGFEIV